MLKRFLVLNGIGLLAGVVVFGILIATRCVGSNTTAMKLAVILIMNTINLLFLMFILGYGLVSYPQMLWLASDLKQSLEKIQNSAAAQFRSMNDTRANIGKAVADVLKTKEYLEV